MSSLNKQKKNTLAKMIMMKKQKRVAEKEIVRESEMQLIDQKSSKCASLRDISK